MHNALKTLSAALLMTALCALPGTLSAAIYKTTDKDGNVVFTDIPPKDQSGEIEVSEHSSYAPPPAPTSAPAPEAETQEEADETQTTVYTSLQITSPADDEPIRENAGNVTIVINAQPTVDAGQGHRIEVLIDGQVASTGAATSISLNNVDRGTHVVTAQVVDADGNILIAAEPVTFHMLRYSALMQRKPAAN